MLVEERILSIQEAFQIGKLEGELSGILSEYQFETALSNEFISVAFEGCSMAIAITSLKNRDSLIDWHLFVSQKGQNYLSQIHRQYTIGNAQAIGAWCFYDQSSSGVLQLIGIR